MQSQLSFLIRRLQTEDLSSCFADNFVSELGGREGGFNNPGSNSLYMCLND